MYRLIESIRLENGQFARLRFHQQRIDHSLAWLHDNPVLPDLDSYFKSAAYPQKGIFKCRLVYNASGIQHVEFIPYSPVPVSSLRMVKADHLDYALKWENRDAIHELVQLRSSCDDVLLIRNGYITDTSYANVVFSDGHVRVTPALPLLCGTMRQCLLDAGEIREDQISVQDISKFKTIQFINSMLEFQGPTFPVSNIVQ